MEKKTEYKSVNKITKGALAIILASTVVFPGANVFADETTSETAIIDLQEDSNSDSDKVETPSLLPGDFFYFSKILIEKIRLALTIDDIKEAKLIADYATERLEEAEALFVDGNEEAALETMKKAIENMESADDQVTAVDDGASDEIVEENKEIGDVKEVLSQNIIALTAAMEKVKNPVAKAALQKNIEKRYAKVSKKMEKWEKKNEKMTKKNKLEDTESAPETLVESGSEKVIPEVTESVAPQSTKKEIHQSAVQDKKQAKQVILQNKQEEKAVAKEAKAESKNSIKEKKKENNGKGN
ncbi:DUF5667 domain-containing protein [Bacillus sp. 7884-1]|uniref:DUF5667 domain-containing protein n=1 Tax=Bacillus sp. 7884-1 TaxID=2021693 RepID=UPI001155252D|nr:DUF5667 domain-containing protein [Bacillus sp. 7884-1]